MDVTLAVQIWAIGGMVSVLVFLSPMALARAVDKCIIKQHATSVYVTAVLVCSAVWPVFWAWVLFDRVRLWARER